MIALIGGTGLGAFAPSGDLRKEKIATRFGDSWAARVRMESHEVLFLFRHGKDGNIPPHRINYRANIAAIVSEGVNAVIATAAVGGIGPTRTPGSFGLLAQFIDFTHSRESTFFDSLPSGPVHVDMTRPFCPRLQSRLSQSAVDCSIDLADNLTYACAQGPRFETPAEIRMMGHMGADVVGMTLVPEVVLAREAGLCYASLAVVTNFAAGISPSPLSHREVLDIMDEHGESIAQLLTRTVASYEEMDCVCHHSLDEYGLSFRSLLKENE